MPSSKTAPQWTKEKIEEAFRRFVMEHGRLPRARELNPKYGLLQRRAFDAAFGMSPYSVFSKLARDYYEEMLTLAFQDLLTGEERPAEQREGGA